MGRFYTEDEDQIDNAAPVIVMTHRLWKRHFGSDPGVIGKPLMLDQQPITVIGVLPEHFSFFGDDVDFITPLGTARPQVTSKQGFSIPLGRLPNYFETMKIPVLRGRDINAQDRAASSPVVIINHTMARRYFANEDPISALLLVAIIACLIPTRRAVEVHPTVALRYE